MFLFLSSDNLLCRNESTCILKMNLLAIAVKIALFAARWERSRRDRCHQSLSVFGRISRRDKSDRCRRSLSVFGGISRRDESDRSAIAVINRLAFLAGFRGAMRAIAQRSLSSIA